MTQRVFRVKCRRNRAGARVLLCGVSHSEDGNFPKECKIGGREKRRRKTRAADTGVLRNVRRVRGGRAIRAFHPRK